MTALIEAASSGRSEVVSLLVDREANINAQADVRNGHTYINTLTCIFTHGILYFP